MVFASGDRERIVDALVLDESMNRPSSLLETLMTNRENDDAAYSVDRVGDIQTALTTIETLDTTIDTETSNIGISSIDIEDEISVTYSSSGASTEGSKRKRQKQVNNIKRWLDPDNLLESYSLSGRVIRTL